MIFIPMKNLFYFLILVMATGCVAGKNYNPSKKFGPDELKEDFSIFRNMLEESHPGLYWYTSKDSMDYYFESAASKITDSMPEYKFRNILSYVVSKIRCGHTSIRPSKNAQRFASRTRSYGLPLSIKAWPDTAVISFGLKDSQVIRGVVLTAIENKPVQTIIDSFFNHLSTDGYNTTHKYQVLSNGGNFRNLYSSIYGLKPKMKIDFIDHEGKEKSEMIEVYHPSKDTPQVRRSTPKISKKERKKRALNSTRSLIIDTAKGVAIMEINSFSKNMKIRKFLRHSFRDLKKLNIRNLVVDFRGNGGGNVVLSNLLTRYLARQRFKIADSIYSIRSKSSYRKYIDDYLQIRLFHIFMTKKEADGKFHFRHYENKYFKPRKKNHFDGDIYILTGGNTFSAATLVTKTLRDQENVLVIGEETGGGAYGNTAWLIPEVELPHSRVRFRLPLFRLVIDKNEEKGRGIIPHIISEPTVDDIRRNADFKMEKVMQIINDKKNENL